MTALVLVCGKAFDGVSDALTGPAEILVDEPVGTAASSGRWVSPDRQRSRFVLSENTRGIPR